MSLSNPRANFDRPRCEIAPFQAEVQYGGLRDSDAALRRDIGEFTSLPRLHLFSHRSKFRCIRSTPTEMQSIRENDFECLASTGVKTAVTQKVTFILNAP
jgi:hypothetical protein